MTRPKLSDEPRIQVYSGPVPETCDDVPVDAVLLVDAPIMCGDLAGKGDHVLLAGSELQPVVTVRATGAASFFRIVLVNGTGAAQGLVSVPGYGGDLIIDAPHRQMGPRGWFLPVLFSGEVFEIGTFIMSIGST